MGVLANALPGIRDVRPPLLAGYAWLLFGWLAFGYRVEAGDDGYIRELVDLAADVGSIWTAAAVSVAAYLVGLLSRDLSRTVIAFARQARRLRVEERAVEIERRRQRRPQRDPRGPRGGIRRVGHLAAQTLREALSVATASFAASLRAIWVGMEASGTAEAAAARLRVSLDRSDPIVRGLVDERAPRAIALVNNTTGEARERRREAVDHALQQLTVGLQRELDLPATLLAGDQPELFAEADRVRAEGELRAAMIPPLVAIVVLLAITTSWLWSFALLGILQLLVQSIRREDEARRLIGTALLFGRVRSAAVAQFDTTMRRFAEFDAATGVEKNP